MFFAFFSVRNAARDTVFRSVGVHVWLLCFTSSAIFIVFGMNEKYGYMKKERLSPPVSPKTITDFAVQQSIGI